MESVPFPNENSRAHEGGGHCNYSVKLFIHHSMHACAYMFETVRPARNGRSGSQCVFS